MGILKKGAEQKQTPFLSMVVTAAGNGTRMGIDKIFAQIKDKPVLLHTLQVMERCPAVSEIIVVVRPERLEETAAMCEGFGISKVSKVIRGGAMRLDSVLNGVMEASRETELVGIHDGARPLVTSEIIERTAASAGQFGAAVPAVPVKDTIKFARGGVVTETPDRSCLFAIQTPQIFEEGILKAALEKAFSNHKEITDDAMAVEDFGVPVHLTEGSFDNIKITTPSDLAVAEAIINRRID